MGSQMRKWSPAQLLVREENQGQGQTEKNTSMKPKGLKHPSWKAHSSAASSGMKWSNLRPWEALPLEHEPSGGTPVKEEGLTGSREEWRCVWV